MSITPSVAVDTVKKPAMPTSNGNTLYVGGSGGGNYTTIQSAINDASDGDTVFVYDDSSPYLENIVVNKSLNLIGEDRKTTIIDGNYSDNTIYINANNVKIKGFTIIHGNSSGIGLRESVGCSIKGNIISYNGDGIYLYESNRNVISGNTISSNNGDGIILKGSDFNFIKGNTITDNRCGIHISYIVVSGIPYLTEPSKLNIIKSNNISNNERGIIIDNSMLNLILKNNFLDNEQDAFFDSSHFNRWLLNYWNKPRILPKLIIGEILFGQSDYIKWFNIDWRPALRPYDI